MDSRTKGTLFLLLIFWVNVCSYAQTTDTEGAVDSRSWLSPSPTQNPGTSPASAFQYRSAQRHIINKENISFQSQSVEISPLENEIMNLESLECNAVRERDTTTLVRLWARDFTLDKKQNEIVSSKNALPTYLVLARMIEIFTVIDNNTVFTSGYEVFQEVEGYGKIEPVANRKYFHSWTRKNGLWKLTTKRTDPSQLHD